MERLKSQKVEPPPEVHGKGRLHHFVCLLIVISSYRLIAEKTKLPLCYS